LLSSTSSAYGPGFEVVDKAGAVLQKQITQVKGQVASVEGAGFAVDRFAAPVNRLAAPLQRGLEWTLECQGSGHTHQPWPYHIPLESGVERWIQCRGSSGEQPPAGQPILQVVCPACRDPGKSFIPLQILQQLPTQRCQTIPVRDPLPIHFPSQQPY
jgi:hypothetical protein